MSKNFNKPSQNIYQPAETISASVRFDCHEAPPRVGPNDDHCRQLICGHSLDTNSGIEKQTVDSIVESIENKACFGRLANIECFDSDPKANSLNLLAGCWGESDDKDRITTQENQPGPNPNIKKLTDTKAVKVIISEVFSVLSKNRLSNTVIRELVADRLGFTLEDISLLDLGDQFSKCISRSKKSLRQQGLIRLHKPINSNNCRYRLDINSWELTDKGRKLLPPATTKNTQSLFRELTTDITIQQEKDLLSQIPPMSCLRRAILEILQTVNEPLTGKLLKKMMVDYFQIDYTRLRRANLQPRLNRTIETAKKTLNNNNIIVKQANNNGENIGWQLSPQAQPVIVVEFQADRIRQKYQLIKDSLLNNIKVEIPSYTDLEKLLLLALQESPDGQLNTGQISWLINNYFGFKRSSLHSRESNLLTRRISSVKNQLRYNGLVDFYKHPDNRAANYYQLTNQGQTQVVDHERSVKFQTFINNLKNKQIAGQLDVEEQLFLDRLTIGYQLKDYLEKSQSRLTELIDFINQKQTTTKNQVLDPDNIARSLVRVLLSNAELRVESYLLNDLIAFDLDLVNRDLDQRDSSHHLSDFSVNLVGAKRVLMNNNLLVLHKPQAGANFYQLTPLAQELLQPANPKARHLRQLHCRLQKSRPSNFAIRQYVIQSLKRAPQSTLESRQMIPIILESLSQDGYQNINQNRLERQAAKARQNLKMAGQIRSISRNKWCLIRLVNHE